MTLTTPILHKIDSFDPNNQTTITFSHSGKIEKIRLVIKDSNENTIIYDNTTIISSQLSYVLPSNTLSIGKYIGQVQVFDINNNSSELSEPVLFYCLSTPILSFINLSSNLNSPNIQLNISYFQDQNENISEMVYYLYDNNKIEISKSNTMYMIENHTFYGLNHNNTYYVRCMCKTEHGMVADTDYQKINVRYESQGNNMLFNLINHKCEGYISIKTNIVDVTYEIEKDSYSFKYDIVKLMEDNHLTYNLDFKNADEYSISLKSAYLPSNKPILEMVQENGDKISLSLDNSSIIDIPDMYAKLSVSSSATNYCKYVKVPMMVQRVEDYFHSVEDNFYKNWDNKYMIFKITYKNNMYGLEYYLTNETANTDKISKEVD